MRDYQDIIASKSRMFQGAGLSGWDTVELHPSLKPHQEHGVRFALRTGRSAAFFDTGLGKTRIALEWARVVRERTGRPVLMLTPVACGRQHAREAQSIGVDAEVCREGNSGKHDIDIANYERIDKFDLDAYSGVVLDESGILKSYTGKTSQALIQAFARIPYRLAATATPAPNDYTELGQHSEFVGAMERLDMIGRWFIVSQQDANLYRLKKPAIVPFWDWVASWARCVSKPSDLGFSDEGYDLPPLEVVSSVVDFNSDSEDVEAGGQAVLWGSGKASATGIHKAKRQSNAARADRTAEIVHAEPDQPFIVWCDTDYEADAAMDRLGFDAVEVRGSMSPEAKEEKLMAFADRQVRVLVSKVRICGFGMNFQHCGRQVFMGPSFSYEQFYQAVRRSWRFGRLDPVKVWRVMARDEAFIAANVNRKAQDHDAMKIQMRAAMQRAVEAQQVTMRPYSPKSNIKLPNWL